MTKTSSNSQLSSTLYCVQENKQRGWQVVGKNSSEIGETRLPMTYCTHLRRDRGKHATLMPIILAGRFDIS